MIAFTRQAEGSEDAAKSRTSLTNISVEDWKAVKSSTVFGNMSVAFVEELAVVSNNRIYMPGDLIIQEGSEDDSMFIMVSGSAAVFAYSEDQGPPARRDGASQHTPSQKRPMTR